MRRPVFLVGMMGAGKSTVGAALAAQAGADFCDLDRRIALVFARTPAALLADSEAALRRCERAALRSLLAEPGIGARALVVACGGGTVIDPDNRADMRRAGAVVLLELSPAALAERLARDPAERPLLYAHTGDGSAAPLAARVAALWAAREAYYREAEFTVDASGSVDEVVARVRAAVEARA